jgi:hypothetical protein
MAVVGYQLMGSSLKPNLALYASKTDLIISNLIIMLFKSLGTIQNSIIYLINKILEENKKNKPKVNLICPLK